ncbi:MAG: helix-turn-helix transcriptional regulator [Lachnospiraceae bacterium]|nr:helix-turn-helix transcriptional regulator [Lachnospiraceae bacterium]
MSIVYKSNEQVLIEIKKVMLETKTTQREIADKLGIKPQGLTKILNKKNFGFEDAQKILSAMGYDLIVDFSRSQNPTYTE